MQSGKITIKDMLQTLFKREFYLDIALIIFLCIPPVLVVLFFSIKLDRLFEFQPFINTPYNIILFILFSTLGATIVWHAYTYLVIIGKGSPCPKLGGTRKLVTCGPYSLVRHPSVIGKALGIIGLGCLSGSPFFTFIVVPALIVWSIFFNRFIQEKGCVKRFGKDYLEYRKSVPMFIPRLGRAKPR